MLKQKIQSGLSILNKQRQKQRKTPCFYVPRSNSSQASLNLMRQSQSESEKLYTQRKIPMGKSARISCGGWKTSHVWHEIKHEHLGFVFKVLILLLKFTSHTCAVCISDSNIPLSPSVASLNKCLGYHNKFQLRTSKITGHGCMAASNVRIDYTLYIQLLSLKNWKFGIM